MRSRRIRLLGLALAGLAVLLPGGCASLTNPVADGIPVRKVPEELLVSSHKHDCTIPLQLLRQPTPDTYRLAPGDVLAVFVEGVLGPGPSPQIPVNSAGLLLSRDQRRLPPSSGYPVPVNDDGTIYLPRYGHLRVAGMTIPEVQQAVRDAYIPKILKEESTTILASLLQPRQYVVLVLRQEASSFASGANGIFPTGKRGTGWEIELQAYENDVAHALARTGGLPGLDACNEVIVHKRSACTPQQRAALLEALGKVPANANPLQALNLPGPVVRIPLRGPHGEAPPVRPEDVTLESGDIVFLEANEYNVFYAGGLLPSGEYQLPRDRDMDVLEAVAYVKGPLINGAFGGSNLSGELLKQGIGNPSPTWLTVVRRTPGGGQVPINVDLAVALRDPRERILVRPGDMLILQEKPQEAMTRYFTQTFLNFNVAWEVIRSRRASGILDISAPDRLQGRLPNVNFVHPQ